MLGEPGGLPMISLFTACLIATLSGAVHAGPVSVSGDLDVDDHITLIGTMTIKGNAFSVGSSSLSVSGGIIGGAGQPGGRFYRNSTAQTIVSGVGTTIFSDTQSYGQGGISRVATSSDTITVPSGGGGIYLISCGVQFQTGATGERFVYISINGLDHAQTQVQSASTITSLVATDILNLSAADVIKCGVRFNGGGTALIYGTGTFIAAQKLW